MIAWKILVEKCGVLWSMWDDGGHAIVYAGNGFKNVPPPGWGKLAAFREEITNLDESFRNSVGYFDISDLRRALENLQQLKDILNTLGLLRVEAPKDS